MIDEIIALYLQNERQNLNLLPTHKALLIMDVFIGQMTDDVFAALNKNHIHVVNVPTTMTRFYQPLDLTVNVHAKKFMKNKFNSCYINQVTKQVDEGVKLDQVIARRLLSALKPFHAG